MPEDIKPPVETKAVPPAAAVPPVTTEPVVAAPKAEESNLDELGYEKVASTEPEKKVETKPDLKLVPDKIEVPSTGYGEKPPEVEVQATPPEEKKDVDLGFELKVDEIIPKDEVSKVKEFAKKHSLTKEQAQAYFDLRKTEVQESKTAFEAAQKAQKLEVQQTRANWHKELKDDPTFGGDKFDYNIQRAEKVLQEFMPGTKKMLTERGSMLPPYVMRDLVKLAEHLYSTQKLTQGDPSVAPKEKEEVDEALAFYQ